MKPASSEFFAFAALVCRDSNRQLLADSLAKLRAEAGKSPDTVLHWSKNMKDHSFRKHAVMELAGLPIRLLFVCVPKAAIVPSSHLANSTEGYYNYAARLLLERIGFFTDRRQQIERREDASAKCESKVTFARVKGFKPHVLRDYVEKLRARPDNAAWANRITKTIGVSWQSENELLQWSDVAAGAFDAAVRSDKFGRYEPTYLRALGRLIDRSEDGRIFGYGMKSLGGESYLRDLPWWTDGWWLNRSETR